MGIPSYFYEIIRRYGDRFFGISFGSSSVGRLFLDLNCCIHGCKNRVLQKWKNKISSGNRHFLISSKLENQEENDSFENDVIKEVIDTILRFCKETQPTDLIYIAVDGVVPVAKMKQQRERRLRAVETREEIRRIYECNDREPPIEWDSNAITPGTNFMKKLCYSIKQYLNYISEITKVENIILNDVNSPGEGEQKIFTYMRTNPGRDESKEDIIYGLDADLIILSILQKIMGEQYSPIALLREKQAFGKLVKNNLGEDELIRFKVSEFADIIPDEWGGGSCDAKKEQLLCDYVILMSLMGNDFVPHTPSLTFRTEGTERLLDAYRRVGKLILSQDDTPGEDRFIINWKVIADILSYLEPQEHIILKDEEEKIEKIQTRILSGQIPYRHSIVEDPVEQDILAMDWEHIRYHSSLADKSDWRDIYYNRICGSRGEWSSTKEITQRVVMEYQRSIMWCWEYYSGYDVAADKYYPYVSGPLLGDIIEYFNKIGVTPVGSGGEPSFKVDNIPEDVQLIIVLPPQSHHLLSKKAKGLAKYCYDLYPDVFMFWDYCKKHEWEREGFLPQLPIRRIVDAFKESI
jgi:5'-3' exonuclease